MSPASSAVAPILALLIVGPSLAVEPTLAITPTQAREDVKLAIDAVEAGMPDLYWRQSRRDWEAARAAALAGAETADEAADVYRLLRPLMSRIGEGHLGLAPGAALAQESRMTASILPLELHWSDEGVFIVQGHGDASDLPKGSRLLSINDETPAQLLTELMAGVGHDGAIPTGAMREGGGRGYAVVRRYLRGQETAFRLRYRTPDGAEVERTVAAVKRSALSALPPSPEAGVATLEWLEDGTAYLNVPTFEHDPYEAAGTTFHQTMQAIFDELHARGATRLILDLRENGGGDEPNESVLFSYLSAKPLRKYAAVEARGRTVSVVSQRGQRYETEIYDEAEMAFQRSIGGGRLTRRNIPPDGLMSQWTRSSPVFEGRLVVLAGGDTFSGGAELASMLRHRDRAVFVGEEVGGADKGNTSGYRWRLTLPNSGVKLAVPLLQFRMNWPEPTGGDRGVMPDCPVPPRVEELGERRDTAWRTALAMVRQDWKRPADAVCPPTSGPRSP